MLKDSISESGGISRRSVLRTALSAGIALQLRPFSAQRSAALFEGGRPGEELEVESLKFCWCPAGRFVMGSSRNEPERRPEEDQVEVILTNGFWAAKHETTQGAWKQFVGHLAGPLTSELPAGNDLPVGNVNFIEAENFCVHLTERAHGSGALPGEWEFRSPQKPNGSTHAGRGRRQQPRSAIA